MVGFAIAFALWFGMMVFTALAVHSRRKVEAKYREAHREFYSELAARQTRPPSHLVVNKNSVSDQTGSSSESTADHQSH